MQSGYFQYIDTLQVQFHLIFVLNSSKYVRNCRKQITSHTRASTIYPKWVFRFGCECYTCFTGLSSVRIGNHCFLPL